MALAGDARSFVRRRRAGAIFDLCETNDDKYVMHRPVSAWGGCFYMVFRGLDANNRPLVLFTGFGVTEYVEGRHGPKGG